MVALETMAAFNGVAVCFVFPVLCQREQGVQPMTNLMLLSITSSVAYLVKQLYSDLQHLTTLVDHNTCMLV